MMGFPFSFQATLCFDGKATVVATAAATVPSTQPFAAVASAAAALIPPPPCLFRRASAAVALLPPTPPLL